jgi:hypothetical protein
MFVFYLLHISSKPLKEIRDALKQDIQALFDIFLELGRVHHNLAVAIRKLLNPNVERRERASSSKEYLTKATDNLRRARANLYDISRRLLQVGCAH